jgi:hypothetical protein
VKRKILLLLMSVVLVAALSVSYVGAKSPLAISKYDITKTTAGVQIAGEAVQRWQGYGWNFDHKELKVYELAPEDYLVAPASAKIELEYIKQSDGSVKLEPKIVTASPSASLLGTKDMYVMRSQYWGLMAAECFARHEGITGWIDHCYQLHKLMGETDSQKDYYTLTHYATAKSKFPFPLTNAWITCQKHSSSSTMWWVDWNPRTDQAVGQCGSITIGISFGAVLTYTGTICKSGWDITKYTEPGKFMNRWYGTAWWSEREVAYMVCVKVPQGGWPRWGLTANYLTI